MHETLSSSLLARYAPQVDGNNSQLKPLHQPLPPSATEAPETFPAFSVSPDYKAVIQSALWDPTDSVLRLFIDAYADVVMDIEGCRAGRGRLAHSSPATVMFLNDGHYNWPMRGYIVQCRWRAHRPSWAALTFKSSSGDRGSEATDDPSRHSPSPVSVHQVGTAAEGTLAACLGVAYSHQDSSEWVTYHSKLGVEKFHQYYVAGIHTDSKDPVRPVSHGHLQNMSWQELFPLGPELRYLFSQITMYNECLYRFRHAYEYLLVIDTDEYVRIALPQYQNVPLPLPAFLSENMPEHVAAMLLLIWAYPLQCQPESGSGTLVARSMLREPTAQVPGLYEYVSWINGRNKMIIRPVGVLELCVHRICTVADDWDKQVFIPHDQAYVKHFRRWQFWDDKCGELQEDPDPGKA